MYLVISETHSLLPFAHRLRAGEGQEVEVLIWRARYEEAWDGKFHPVKRGQRGQVQPEDMAPVVAMAEQDNMVVLSDVPSLPTVFGNVPGFHGTHQFKERPVGPERLGFWFDGEALHLPHLLVYDLGQWPGGLGPSVPGGLTLLRLDPDHDLLTRLDLTKVLDELKAATFKGLVQVGLDSSLQVQGALAGWPFLQTHAFVGELDSLAALLNGEHANLEQRVVTVLPVSQPPWPNLTTKRSARWQSST